MPDKTTYKIDLHTHSIQSKDGGISLKEYQQTLDSGKLDYIAITDHNEIDNTLKIHKKIGEQIIPGEEIKTKQGEVIGLFLKRRIKPGQQFAKTLDLIHQQGGITYLPHPFDTRRSGANFETIRKNLDKIDIIERFNSRIITPGVYKKIEHFFENEGKAKPYAAGSDAHSVWELGNTYTIIEDKLTRDNIEQQLETPSMRNKTVTPIGFAAPAWNKIQKWINLKKS